MTRFEESVILARMTKSGKSIIKLGVVIIALHLFPNAILAQSIESRIKTITKRGIGSAELSKYPKQGQGAYIFSLVRENGGVCDGYRTHAFMGRDEHGTAYWSLLCLLGHYWLLSVDRHDVWTMKGLKGANARSPDFLGALKGKEPKYKRLLAKPDEYVRTYFEFIANRYAKVCPKVVKQKFLHETADKAGHWIVKCDNETQFRIIVRNDETGRTSSISCKNLLKHFRVRCED